MIRLDAKPLYDGVLVLRCRGLRSRLLLLVFAWGPVCFAVDGGCVRRLLTTDPLVCGPLETHTMFRRVVVYLEDIRRVQGPADGGAAWECPFPGRSNGRCVCVFPGHSDAVVVFTSQMGCQRVVQQGEDVPLVPPPVASATASLTRLRRYQPNRWATKATSWQTNCPSRQSTIDDGESFFGNWACSVGAFCLPEANHRNLGNQRSVDGPRTPVVVGGVTHRRPVSAWRVCARCCVHGDGRTPGSIVSGPDTTGCR